MKIYSDRVEFKNETVYGSPAEIAVKMLTHSHRELSTTRFEITFFGEQVTFFLGLYVAHAEGQRIELFRHVTSWDFGCIENLESLAAGDFRAALTSLVGQWLKRPAAVLYATLDPS